MDSSLEAIRKNLYGSTSDYYKKKCKTSSQTVNVGDFLIINSGKFRLVRKKQNLMCSSITVAND